MAYDGLKAYTGDKPYVFISYLHNDAEKVTPIMAALQKAGCRYWYDGGIRASASWRAEITKRIESCSVLAVFATKGSMKSTEVIAECTFAVNLGKKVQMVCLDQLEYTDVDLNLRMLYVNNQRIDVDRGSTPEMIVRMMTSVIRECIDASGSAPAETPHTEPKPADPKPAAPTAKPADSEGYTEGGEISFGTYKGEELRWIVLKVENGRALAVTRCCIDNIKFSESGDPCTWERSSLRKWLNETFFDEAFSRQEQWSIYPNNNDNTGNKYYETEDEKPTEDYVFCLSLDEANELFKDDAARRAQATPYAVKRGAFKNSAWWWLRTNGSDDGKTSVVTEQGRISYAGSDVGDEDISVRPAVILDKPKKKRRI